METARTVKEITIRKKADNGLTVNIRVLPKTRHGRLRLSDWAEISIVRDTPRVIKTARQELPNPNAMLSLGLLYRAKDKRPPNMSRPIENKTRVPVKLNIAVRLLSTQNLKKHEFIISTLPEA
jgi:hypothetical protein